MLWWQSWASEPQENRNSGRSCRSWGLEISAQCQGTIRAKGTCPVLEDRHPLAPSRASVVPPPLFSFLHPPLHITLNVTAMPRSKLAGQSSLFRTSGIRAISWTHPPTQLSPIPAFGLEAPRAFAQIIFYSHFSCIPVHSFHLNNIHLIIPGGLTTTAKMTLRLAFGDTQVASSRYGVCMIFLSYPFGRAPCEGV